MAQPTAKRVSLARKMLAHGLGRAVTRGWRAFQAAAVAALLIGVVDVTPISGQPATPPPSFSSATLPSSSMPVFPTPSFKPTRAITVRSVSQFKRAWSKLRPGHYLDVRGVTFTGMVVFAKALPAPAVVHFDSQVRFLGAPRGSQRPSVWVHDSQNIRFFGGDVTGAGNDGIRFDDNTNVLWRGFNVHDTAGTCVLMRGINRDTSGMDIRGTLSRCGYDLSLDPHAEKGTGLHGFNVGTGTGHLVKDSRFVLWVHDQPYGAAVQVQGVQNSKLYLDARRIMFQAQQQIAGNAVQLWGSDTRDFDMSYLYGDALAGKAVATDGGLDSSNSNISVDYARSSNVRLSPKYEADSAITYGDVR